MNTRIIPLEELESVQSRDWVDNTRRPFICGEKAYVPVSEGHPFDCSLPPRRPYRGRGYQMIGPIAVVHGERPGGEEVAELVRWRRPRGVLWLKSVHGVTRTPNTELLAGSCGEVIHRENGISFRLDPSRVMFAQGNREEKTRMQGIILKGERVADMYAGIGYFSIPAALAGARVHAMEINPVAYSYLEQNIAGNGVESCVLAECGDCQRLLSGTYDRFIMGHFESPAMLSVALEHAIPGSVLHVHSSGKSAPDIADRIIDAGFGSSVRCRRVKKTGPGQWHHVQDVTLS
ncbi:MAG: methyltransferase [Methanolinea sp. SDB]|nr:MAG: methyltransferase [Methanolinea sp. SDB]